MLATSYGFSWSSPLSGFTQLKFGLHGASGRCRDLHGAFRVGG